MKEDWLKDIHDRMADYEVPEPAGVWDDIEAQLPAVPTQRARWRVRRHLVVWGSSAAAVAAVVALAFVLQPTATELVPQSTADADRPTQTTPTPSAHEPSNVQPTASPKSGDIAAAATPYIYNEEKKERNDTAHTPMEQPVEPRTNAENKDVADAAQPTTPQSNALPKEKADDTRRRQILPSQGSQTASHDLAQAVHRSDEQRFSVSVFAMGSSRASHAQNEPGYLTSNDFSNETSDEYNIPFEEIVEYNKDKEVQTTAKHRQPVRFGLTVAYQLNDRWAVETGLTYTRLSSELRSGTEGYYFTGDQRLHYVGVPLTLRARLVSLAQFDAYAAATALTELRVAGTVERGYVLDYNTWSVKHERVHSHPVQCSLGLSLGVQYRLAPVVAVYAEPGVGYYFDDGSSVSTVYSEHPFNFHLNLGLRFTLGGR